MQLVRSVLFTIIMWFNTILLAIASGLLIFFPFSVRAKYIQLYPSFNIWILRIICGIRFEVKGKENLPKGESFIIFSNHQSTWETFAFQLIFPTLCFVAKKELLYVPLFGWALAMLKPIAIKRGTGRAALKQLVTQGIDRLKDNIVVVIFPEGTRVPPGEEKEYKIGGGMLAEKSGYPVVPVAHNAGYYWPKRGFIKKAGLITVNIGEPIPTKGRKAKEITEQAKAYITSHTEPAHYK